MIQLCRDFVEPSCLSKGCQQHKGIPTFVTKMLSISSLMFVACLVGVFELNGALGDHWQNT
jgi:hypothetical protein